MSADKQEMVPPPGIGPDELSRLLDLELIQKRAEWQKTNARHKTLRSLAILFVFLVVAAALAGFYLVFTGAIEIRPHRPPQTTTVPAP